ncbi:OSCP-domain-containing protein [Tothia fuscella]|uniref:ATP synthase subunit 5, mitochondrial n=1 Tax=Tothia fuscella TaxID=1048955 RepID=A0A9P4TVZ9_9PEZI|nr:OSCP-domain-containing protein [Tothia fuscella]
MLAGRLALQTARSSAPRASIASRAAIRSYASPATSSQQQPSGQPPIALYGIDGTYATALYTAAAKTSALEPVSKAMESLHAVFKKDPKLVQILQAPTLKLDEKKQIVAELEKHTGGQDKEKIVKNFLETLAENNRLGTLESVTENFGRLMSAYRGEVELIVTSAAQLDGKVLKQLENAISKSSYVGSGKKLKVVPKVNPDIRGGLIVEIGDQTIDLSVSAKMAKMNKLLRDQL